MQKFIDSPYSDGKAELQFVIKDEVYKKEIFKVYEFYYKCEETGKEFTTTEAGDINMLQIFNQYRERKGILFPEQLIAMRESYKLSAAKMSDILGFGANTISNYEKGEMPSDSSATLLKVASEPAEFKSIVETKKSLFSEKQYKDLIHRIDNLIRQENKTSLFNIIWNTKIIPDSNTGYRAPDFDKFANTVLYFINIPWMFTTRLNKYLFYSDFLNFKHTGYSITGLQYAAIPQGPVPNGYALLFSLLENENYIERESTRTKNDEVYDRYVPKKEFDSEVFCENELKVLKFVKDMLRRKRTPEIIDLSHKEKGWINNVKVKGIISYQEYGFELTGI